MARKRKKRKPPEKPTKLKAGPIADGYTTLAECDGATSAKSPMQGCKGIGPEHQLRRGRCIDCDPFFAVHEATAGGIESHRRREKYNAVKWGDQYIPTAGAKPQIGNGYGPKHYLNMTPKRLCDVLGPTAEEEECASGSPSATQKSMGRTLKQEFAKTKLTWTAERLFTDKESEAVELFVSEGLGVVAVAKILGIHYKAVQKRLASALRKMKGGGAEITMPSEDIVDLEAKNKVVALL